MDTAKGPFLDPRLASRRANVAGRRGEVNSRRERREGREASGRRDRAPGHGGTGYASSQAVSSCYRLAHVCARAYFLGDPTKNVASFWCPFKTATKGFPHKKHRQWTEAEVDLWKSTFHSHLPKGHARVPILVMVLGFGCLLKASEKGLLKKEAPKSTFWQLSVSHPFESNVSRSSPNPRGPFF